MTAPQAHSDSPFASVLVLASDIHIREPGDPRESLLLSVLERLSPEVEHLVLNGDIFDFCFGDSDYFRHKFRMLGRALEAVAARGTIVHFVEGNHEFHMEAMGWRGVRIVKDEALALTLHDGTKIKLTHGDLLGGDPLYGLFRSVIKSRFIRSLARLVPGPWLDAYALSHARMSRATDRYRQLDHHRILSAFDRWLGREGFDHGVIGHFHVPYAEPRIDRPGLLLSVHSWEHPNLLVYQPGSGFRRAYFPTTAIDQVRLDPVQSIGGDWQRRQLPVNAP